MAAVLFFAALDAAAPAAAQTETDQRAWTAVSVQGRVSAGSPWRWASDSLVRARDGAGTLDLLAERVIVTRDLTWRSSAGIGYAYGAGFPDGGSLREHRFVQQYAWSTGVTWGVSLKSRLEERVITGQDAVQFRVRQQVRVTWPLVARRGLLGVASEELLVRTNSTASAPRGVDSNRMSLGVRRTLTPRTGVEMAYVNVYWRDTQDRRRRSHVMSATLAVSW